MRTSIAPQAAQAVCVVILVAAVTSAFALLFPGDPGQAYLGFSAVLVAVTLWLGSAAGFLALGLSAVAAAYFLLKGEGFAISDPVEGLGLVTFVALGTLIVTLLGAARSRQRRADEACAVLASERSAKAALLAELSHRIGNDLTMLASLAELQKLATRHDETKSALTGLIDRIYVVGSVYRRLNVDAARTVAVDMPGFLGGLCADLRTAHLGIRPVALDVRCEAMTMPASRAALVGLVLNEAVTNALKHAFPDERSGTIGIVFGHDPDEAGWLRLVVVDDGSGFDASAPKSKGMGQRLLRSLASQLQGQFMLERVDQTSVARLRFPERADAGR